MNWKDVRGGSRVTHVVVRTDPGIFVHVLCKKRFNYYPPWRKRRKSLPHCLNCIAALKKLIRESDILYEFKPAKNFISPLTGKKPK